MSVKRIYVEKMPEYAVEAKQLLWEIRHILLIKNITGLRFLNRYDVEGVADELYNTCKPIVFSEPQVDVTYDTLPEGGKAVFAVEYLPGQYDQRAASCEECIQLVGQCERPTVRTARVYILEGDFTEDELNKVKKHVINPVESREADLAEKATLQQVYETPDHVETLNGFTTMDMEAVQEFVKKYGLAMDKDDLAFCRDYFASEHRDPTLTEIRMIDTYWSDHCRHTTFLTTIDEMNIEKVAVEKAFKRYLMARETVYGERISQKPINLMDMATMGGKYLKKIGQTPNIDVSEEINACSIKIDVDVNGVNEPWLLMFKNETHNHPTEIEPFGGAATCLGGAIRDPLSGRTYVYQAMRVTGAADPLVPVADTMPGKLPQRKLVTTAAAGYSSYGNQIGLATGLVDEQYHPGYAAKRLEIGAVVGAAPAKNVRRDVPAPGDKIVLLGGRTGRDGIGGATGSSKSHKLESIETCGAEVQKGNAPTERKLQRLFRNGEVTRLIKRCNDFGAGGVSVAIGELADGLMIELDKVPKKYDGLDGTELAISESQERMAVVVAPEDADAFIAAAERENLEAYRVAVVTEEARMVMQWKGNTVANLSRAFLDTNGAVKHADVAVAASDAEIACVTGKSLREIAGDLKFASRRGLVERFDSTIGAGSVLMPFGGKLQRSPAQAMAATFPVLPEQTTDQASVMAWGCDPDWLTADPFLGAQASIITSVAKIVAAGAAYQDTYLTLQEFFERLRTEPQRWGKPFQALLGALEAQLGLSAAAIGGKDSMSGSFLDRDVPPTVISFAIAPLKANEVISTEFKKAGHPVYVFGTENLTDYAAHRAAWDGYHKLCKAGKVSAAWAVEAGGVAEAVMKMAFGNQIGFAANEAAAMRVMPGMIIAELNEEVAEGTLIGYTTEAAEISLNGETVSISELSDIYENVLEGVYPNQTPGVSGDVPVIACKAENRVAPKIGIAKPKVLIPVFPGTNCEYDSARAAHNAGLDTEILVINNQSAQGVADSAARFARAAKDSQIIFIPGGFSGGDEPDGSGKFITAFFRNPEVTEATMELLKNRDGLMLGICNGFQALIKLGLVPFGEIIDTDETCPTLSYNVIGRHQSKIVSTRIASNRSPWLSKVNVGDVVNVPISHGEGRFLCSDELLKKLAENGQIATQYVDLAGNPTMDVHFNPNGSNWAIEGITSPDGRILGKMGHSERVGSQLYVNVPGNYDLHLFESAKDYYSI